MLTSYEIAHLAVKALDDKKARDIQILKTDKVTVLADYFILCTASSSTHGKTLAEETDKLLSQAGEPPLRREGYRSGGWTLLDFGCVQLNLWGRNLTDTRFNVFAVETGGNYYAQQGRPMSCGIDLRLHLW